MKSPREPSPGPEGPEPTELTDVFTSHTAPLPPPPGTFEAVRDRARSRRRGRAMWAGALVAGCVAAACVAITTNGGGDPEPATVAVSPASDSARPASPPPSSAPATTPDGTPDAGSGKPSGPADSKSAKPSEQSATPDRDSTFAGGPPVCRTEELTITLGRTDGAAGSLYRQLRVRNDADKPCTLYGFPGVSLVDSAGHQLGKPADRAGSQAAGRVVMKPNQREQVTLRSLTAAVQTTPGCHRAKAAGFRVYPPGERASAVIHAKGLEACTSTKVTTLTVTSFGVH
ncbi:DUF4232 domain-containing protein [Streptomyces sp. NPDC058045]|uniref:DUF4232 domain-containing protein n=1 Tax=Streptomyces sp. NPDC058045 TaxID=3346311 RepID=UPI0036E23881